MLKLTFEELEFVLGGTRGGSDSFSKSCPDCTEKKQRNKLEKGCAPSFHLSFAES